jgi:hypothetical protein
LAVNLGSVHVYVTAGDGTLCDASDLFELEQEFPTSLLEAPVHAEADNFDRALTKAGVAHTTSFYGCGIHTWRYWNRDLAAFWPEMEAAFGTSPPVAFDYRSTDAEFSVWGWTIVNDPTRAAEFLDVIGASAAGLGLTGSGLATVKTASYFAPWGIVDLQGAVDRYVTAGKDGRITFTVDLGAAHTLQQYTPAESVLEAVGGYFTSRTVSFRPR